MDSVPFLPRKEWLATLARKRVTGCSLMFNGKGELLIVKPRYKDVWALPGGCSDKHESPTETTRREVKEEVGLDKEAGRLIGLDYMSRPEDDDEILEFFFYGGVLTDEEILSIVLQEVELEKYQLVPTADLMQYFSPRWAIRFPLLLEAIKTNIPAVMDTSRIKWQPAT